MEEEGRIPIDLVGRLVDLVRIRHCGSRGVQTEWQRRRGKVKFGGVVDEEGTYLEEEGRFPIDIVAGDPNQSGLGAVEALAGASRSVRGW